jgi:hypothetical protein
MVFGNAGGRSGSGVGFTRDPATGINDVYMDFLFNAQGEDVVSGRRSCVIGETTLREGDHLSLDGDGGGIYAGELEVVQERPEPALRKIDSWRQA